MWIVLRYKKKTEGKKSRDTLPHRRGWHWLVIITSVTVIGEARWHFVSLTDRLHGQWWGIHQPVSVRRVRSRTLRLSSTLEIPIVTNISLTFQKVWNGNISKVRSRENSNPWNNSYVRNHMTHSLWGQACKMADSQCSLVFKQIYKNNTFPSTRSGSRRGCGKLFVNSSRQ